MGEEYAEVLQNTAVLYDMMAMKDNQTDSVNVVLEKLDVLQILALDVGKNFEATVELLQGTYESMGYTAFDYEIGTVTIGDQEFDSMNVSAEMSGVKMYQTMIGIKCGGYLATITLSTFGENTIPAILEGFYLV